MRLPEITEIVKIYSALRDPVSRRIYKHRLLYSLTGDTAEITDLVYEDSCASEVLRQYRGKVCYYGAGGGFRWIAQDDRNARLVIDKHKTASMHATPPALSG